MNSKCNPQLSSYGHWWVVYTYLVPVGNRNLWSWSKFWLFDISNSQLKSISSIGSLWPTKGFLPIFSVLGWTKYRLKSLRENVPTRNRYFKEASRKFRKIEHIKRQTGPSWWMERIQEKSCLFTERVARFSQCSGQQGIRVRATVWDGDEKVWHTAQRRETLQYVQTLTSGNQCGLFSC